MIVTDNKDPVVCMTSQHPSQEIPLSMIKTRLATTTALPSPDRHRYRIDGKAGWVHNHKEKKRWTL